jgi:hypothetical protein
MRKQLTAIGERGRIDVCRLIGQAGGQLEFPTTQIAAKVHNATPRR